MYLNSIFLSRDKIFNALRQIRAEGTDEFLISFFFQSAITRMEKNWHKNAATPTLASSSSDC